MKKNILLLFIVSVLTITAKSQVTIGSLDAPEPGAVLELKNTKLGFLPTRVELKSLNSPEPLPAHKEGMLVYNTNVTDTLRPGFYYNTGEQWLRLSAPSFSNNWFYMPSIVFDTSVITPKGENKEIDLYGEFKKQLNDKTGVVASAGAPNIALSTIPKPTEINYYVTAYDHDVFEIDAISAEGKMTYRILNPASEATYINIVFVEK